MAGPLEIKKSVCMWCHGHCPVSVYVQDGQLVKIEEARGHPDSQSVARVVRSCPRALAAAEWFYHPDRLTFPLKRAGEKGEGKWQQISWEQALDEIAQKLAEIKSKYGPEALASTRGTYRTHDEFRARFLNLFGSPNLVGVAANVCFAPANEVACLVLGWPCNNSQPQPTTRCVLLLGTNQEQSRRRTWFDMLEAKKRGAKLIVIDPRRTASAEAADLWLQLRPGTDSALYLSMIDVIIQEGLYDREFVARWCHGFDKLAERARQYPPEKVAEITWVTAEKIREAARTYATSKPAICHHHMGLEQIPNTIEALHARFILPAITGNLDIPGGEFVSGPSRIIAEFEMELSHMLSPEQKAKMLGSDRFRLFSSQGYDMIQESARAVWGKQIMRYRHCFAHGPTAFRTMLTDNPYPVRAMITVANNPLLTQPNTRLVYRAIKSLDLYVVSDFWLTPSADIADYVLPAASWLERSHLETRTDTADFVDAGEAALPARMEGKYDRRTDFELWQGLGVRLGQKEHWPWESLEAACDYRLSPLGYTIKEFIHQKAGYHRPAPEYKKYERLGFGTPTRKVELYSTILERLGYDPLPSYREPPESPVSTPELARQYPFILITGGRFLPMYHSEHRQIASLRRQHPHPIAQLNPETARRLGIADGDWIWIETPRGRVRQKCQLFPGIDPRVVHAEHGWWFPELPGEEPWLHGVWESNINVVTDDDPDHCNEISGAWPLRGELCRVYKAKTYSK